jgi:hypothetical protein
MTEPMQVRVFLRSKDVSPYPLNSHTNQLAGLSENRVKCKQLDMGFKSECKGPFALTEQRLHSIVTNAVQKLAD